MPKSFSAELGAWKASVERRLDNLASGNRLDHASLDGTTLYLKGDGELGRIGRQPDGSNGVHIAKVQPPPQLTAPILTVGEQAGTCLVEWDGNTFDGRRMPLIHGHTEVWAELVGEDWSPTVAPGDTAKRVGTIRDRTGGEVVVALPQAGVWAVWLRAMGADRETAGPWSPVSQVEISPLVDTSEWEEKLEIERERITEADERLTFGQDVLDGKLEFLDTERLPAIESTLSEKAESSDLDQLNTLLSGRERVYTGEGEPDDTTAARGVTYEWVGEPHASESVKRVNGVEVARNPLTNPSFEPGLEGLSWSPTVSPSHIWGVNVGAIGDYAVSVEIEDASSTQGWLRNLVTFEPSDRDRWVGFSTVSRQSVGVSSIRHYIQVRQADGSLSGSYLTSQGIVVEPLYEATRQTSVMEVPAGATEVSVWLRPGHAVDFGRYHTDAWMTVLAATEADALAQVETYFDGDTEDQLDAPATEGTIYYQTDGDEIVAIWRRSSGEWVKLPMRDEVFSSISVGKLVAGDASINEAVIDKLWAELGVFDRIDGREGWIGGVALQDSAVTSRSVDTEEFFAAVAVIEEIWTNIVRAKMIETQGFITEDMIATGAITTPKLTVTEDMVAQIASFIRIEAGELASNDIESMRIISSLIEATVYLIRNAAGDVSVRLDGMDNYVAGRLHAGMNEGAGITFDYGENVLNIGEDDSGEPSETRTWVAPYMIFETSQPHTSRPRITVDPDNGGIRIFPGSLPETATFRSRLSISGDVRANRTIGNSARMDSGFWLTNSDPTDVVGGMGINDGGVRFTGPFAGISSSRQTLIKGRYGGIERTISSGGVWQTSTTYAVPAESGTRFPLISTNVSSNTFDQSRVVTSVTGRRGASGHEAMSNQSANNLNPGNASYTLSYMAWWE